MANMSVQLNMNSDDRSADFQLPSLSDNDYHHKRLQHNRYDNLQSLCEHNFSMSQISQRISLNFF